jgi:hypothetical protein
MTDTAGDTVASYSLSAAFVAVIEQVPTLAVIVIDGPPSTLLQGPVVVKLSRPLPLPPLVVNTNVLPIARLAGALVIDNDSCNAFSAVTLTAAEEFTPSVAVTHVPIAVGIMMSAAADVTRPLAATSPFLLRRRSSSR